MSEPTEPVMQEVDRMTERQDRREQDARWAAPESDWLSVADEVCRPEREANALRAREAAWTANPSCTECGRTIESPEKSALIETTRGARVACRRPCFVHAVVRLNPTMNTAAAQRREER